MKFEYKHGMKVYLAGPITGVSDYGRRFAECEKIIRFMFDGVKVLNPAKMPAGHDIRWYMLRCLTMVLRCDAVFAGHGWRRSVGARIEIALARYCGIPVILQGDGFDVMRGASCDSRCGKNAAAQ